MMEFEVFKLLFNILGILLPIYLWIAVIRALLQYSDADFMNPASRFIHRATVGPISFLRMIVPRVNGSDILSPAVLVLLCAALDQYLTYTPNIGILEVLIFGILRSLQVTVNLIVYVILIYVILSWVAPRKVFFGSSLIYSVSEYVLRPVRRIIPTFGGIDISPIILFLALNLVLGLIERVLLGFLR